MEDMEENDIILLNKLEIFQKKIIKFLNVKLNINLSGEEIILYLNNKNIGNIELNLLSCIEFKNLEEIYLNNNKISNIESLKDFYAPKLKKLDFSSHKKNNNHHHHHQHECKTCKRKSSKYKSSNNLIGRDIDILIDNNNLIAKDLEEIKMHIINNHLPIIQKNKNNEHKKKLMTIVLNKLNKLEKKVMESLNVILNINLTGKEIKKDLNNKNIGNIELNLLSCVEFHNLLEINLSNNKISNIESLKDFYAPKLKNLDLSFNQISNISPLKDFSKINNSIEKINLNNNSIKNIEILKSNIFPCIKEINLDNNHIIKKDIDEIKELIVKNDSIITNFIDYIKINDITIRNELMRFFKMILKNINNDKNTKKDKINKNNLELSDIDMICYCSLFGIYNFKENNWNNDMIFRIINIKNNNMNSIMNNMNNINMNNMFMNYMFMNNINNINMNNMFMNNMFMNNINNINMNNMFMNNKFMNNINNINMNMNMNNFMNMFMNNMNEDNLNIDNMNNMNEDNLNIDNMNEYNLDMIRNNIKNQMNDIIMRFDNFLKENDITIYNKFISSKNIIDNIINYIINCSNEMKNYHIDILFIFPDGRKFKIRSIILMKLKELLRRFLIKIEYNPSDFIFIYTSQKLNGNDERTLKEIFDLTSTGISIHIIRVSTDIISA